MDLLKAQLSESTDYFINRCLNLGIINTAKIKAASLEAIKFYKGQKYNKTIMQELLDLDQKWYDSLDNGTPDYSVYEPDIYLAHVWACWNVCSKKTIKDLLNAKLFPPYGLIAILPASIKIADLGCGCGYTTATLKTLMPQATVYGTNFPNTTQRRFAEQMGKEYGFSVLDSTISGILKLDVIFASEYFEHIEDPIAHLKDLCDKNNPRLFITANAFGAKSHGHFNTYKCFGKKVSNKQIGKVFSKYLRYRGYKKLETKFWNNRPTIGRG